MRKLRRQIKSQVQVVKGNLDSVLLNLRNTKLEQLVNKLETTKKRLEKEGDVAMGLALQVLGRVRSVRDSLKRATRPVAVKATQSAKSAKAKTTKAKPVARKMVPKKKKSSRSASKRA